MTRLISNAESWTKVYQTFQSINFAAYDYASVKQSLVERLQATFPESYNDFIESSELIAIVEIFAYVSELLAYRYDVNAHEIFMTDAQRRDSILRLARFISYTAKRPTPASGFCKIASVSTTESVYDANGTNLANTVITWNDSSNSNWKEQFLIVMNRVLEQEFGSATSTSKFSIQDVNYEQYSMAMTSTATTYGAFTFSATVSGSSVPLELTSAVYDSDTSTITERRPYRNSNFALLYARDGSGDGSSSTGFLMLTKQGTLTRQSLTFDGITPNQVYDVTTTYINNTDVWLNNVDSNGAIITNSSSSLISRSTTTPGEWVSVPLVNAQNVIFNTVETRNKYEIETRDNSAIRLIFGDGEFSTIPSGSFDLWFRTSLDESVVIPQSAVVGQSISVPYTDDSGKTQTLTMTVSLTGTVQNGAASETDDHIRQAAPDVYYTQDRMVNGRDYSSYLLQDSSILKCIAVNKSFAGESKYTSWYESSDTYANVNLFTDDGVIYFDDIINGSTVTATTQSSLITGYVQPLLSDTTVVQRVTSAGVAPSKVRSTFNSTELTTLSAALTAPPDLIQVDIYFDTSDNSWESLKRKTIPSSTMIGPLITIDQTEVSSFKYVVNIHGLHMLFHSQTLQFWNTNGTDSVIDYSSARAAMDSVVVLQANSNANGTALLSGKVTLSTTGLATYDTNLDSDWANLPDTHTLLLTTQDDNRDGYNDQLIIGPTMGTGLAELITTSNYVYLTRTQVGYPWVPAPNTAESATSWAADAYNAASNPNALWKRVVGKSSLNVQWIHHSPRYYLIDPTPTNINDVFVLTQGYYTSVVNWAEGTSTIEPTIPTPRDLRVSYGTLLASKMISDSAVLKSAEYRILFGDKAAASDRATVKVVKTTTSTKTDAQIKTLVITAMRSFFAQTLWAFGETLYLPELEAALQVTSPADIAAVVIVPSAAASRYGNLTQIVSAENQLFYPDITSNNIEVVTSYTAENLRIAG